MAEVFQPLNEKPWVLNREKAALLVIDMQNDFVAEGGVMEVRAAREQALPHIKRLIAACRPLSIPVFYTVHVLRDDFDVSPLETAYNPKLRTAGMRAGTPGIEVYPEIAPEPGDIVIEKHRYDAFHGTNLETLLRNIRGPHVVDTVIITGTVTNICCESTARTAFMRDFKVAFVSDACGGLDDASHQATLNIIGLAFGRVMTTDEVIAELTGSA